MQPGLKRKPISGQITIVCALPLYHVFAFITCGLLGMRTGALNMLIPNPRDMPGTSRSWPSTAQHLPGGQHAVQRAGQQRRTSPSSISPAC